MNRPRRPLWWFVLVAGGTLVAVTLVLALGHRPAEDFGATTPEPAPPTATPHLGDVADQPAATTGAVPSVGTRPATPPTAEPVVAPVRLTVPALAIEVPVRPVGVDDEGLMEIPDSGRQVGWYRFGPAPGAQAGHSVLASHVNTAAEGEGVLAGLGRLEPGDTVTVTLEDGSSLDYAVTARRTVPKLDLDADTLFARTGPHRLALVTCGGPWIEERSSYRDNVIVLAEPVAPSR